LNIAFECKKAPLPVGWELIGRVQVVFVKPFRLAQNGKHVYEYL
jgi:hypothetical protein